MLTFKKRGENIYFNLSASSANFTGVSGEDSIKGNMLFEVKQARVSMNDKTRKVKAISSFLALLQKRSMIVLNICG